jgi:tRNA(fMet)-specific endonuclease VapC
MATKPYLLDTNILVALIRGGPLGQFIDATYQLRHQPNKPLISAVTKGEIRSLARRLQWGTAKRQSLIQLLQNEVVSLEIDHPAIMDAYEEIDCFSLSHPLGAYNMGKNDLWIAATAKASGAVLLTTDTDFDHLDPAHIKRVCIPIGSSLPSGGTTGT